MVQESRRKTVSGPDEPAEAGVLFRTVPSLRPAGHVVHVSFHILLSCREKILMPSTLSWIVHDSGARDQAQQILSLFMIRESRDELGLGAIRNSFADQLFPGTSTLQRRLRYMLFIPWIYKTLEKEVSQKHVAAKDFASEAGKREKVLSGTLVKAEDRRGAYGKDLKRLPSSIYWAGLGSWGIRRIPHLSQEEYYRCINDICAHKPNESVAVYGDDDEENDAEPVWRRGLPDMPSGFPDQADFALTRTEAEFILECLGDSCGTSLLYVLADRCRQDYGEEGPSFGSAPWLCPGRGAFPVQHRNLLHHARLFSQVMNGAALSYNFQLAAQRAEKGYSVQKKALSADAYGEKFTRWAGKLEVLEKSLYGWNLSELRMLTEGHGHTITMKTMGFVEEWVDRVRVAGRRGNYLRLLSDQTALDLVRDREIFCKGKYSRFVNEKALRQWGGNSGTAPFVYRWPQVTGLLQDLYRGLHSGGK